MNYYKQRNQGFSDGDCFRTAVACILEVDPESIPNIIGEAEIHDETAYSRMRDWFHIRGMGLASAGWNCSKGNFMSEIVELNFGDSYWMFTAFSPTSNVNHVVVMQGTELICDPSCGNSDSDFVEVCGPADPTDAWHASWITINSPKLYRHWDEFGD